MSPNRTTDLLWLKAEISLERNVGCHQSYFGNVQQLMIVIAELGAVALLSFFPTSKFDHAALAGAAGIRELNEWHVGCACTLRQGEATRTLCQRASAAMVRRVESACQLEAPQRFWRIVLSTWRWLLCHQTMLIYSDTLQYLYPGWTLEDLIRRAYCRSHCSPVERSVESRMAL